MKKLSILKKLFLNDKPTRWILNIYLFIIFLGTILMMMPFSSNSGQWTSFIDSLFTTVSAVCVTGLATVTTVTHWSVIGKVIIIILIQLGGLGVMTASSVVALLFNKRMSISDRLYLSEENNALSIEGIIKLVKFILFATLTIEIVGAIFLSFTFIPEFGFIKGILYSLFHSISAFCNAGFDLIGNSSISPYLLNVNINLVISALIILGGIGHKVIYELLEKKFNYKKYSIHTKLVLVMTLGLLFIPMVIFLLVEWNNPNTLGMLTVPQKFMAAFFQSTTLRTAGFSTIDQSMFLNTSTLIFTILMFIGGSPAGTAGGFKTTTFASLFLITKTNIRKDKDINLFKKRLPEEVTEKVISIFTISIAWIVTTIILLSLTDPSKSILDISYEVVSAYGTVGLTRGITGSLSILGRIIIALTMLFGKIGPLSIVLAFIRSSEPRSYRLQEETIIIG